MPRTVQEILGHADELARRFEDYEPGSEDERDPQMFAACATPSSPGPTPSDRSRQLSTSPHFDH